MRFYIQPHRFYCGVDLHARTMYVCILDEAGAIRLDKNLADAGTGEAPGARAGGARSRKPRSCRARPRGQGSPGISPQGTLSLRARAEGQGSAC